MHSPLPGPTKQALFVVDVLRAGEWQSSGSCLSLEQARSSGMLMAEAPAAGDTVHALGFLPLSEDMADADKAKLVWLDEMYTFRSLTCDPRAVLSGAAGAGAPLAPLSGPLVRARTRAGASLNSVPAPRDAEAEAAEPAQPRRAKALPVAGGALSSLYGAGAVPIVDETLKDEVVPIVEMGSSSGEEPTPTHAGKEAMDFRRSRPVARRPCGVARV